jgi:hypothetical protein
MPLSNAERQRRHRIKKRTSTQKCSICDGWLWGTIATQIGHHQKCDRAGYQREYRKIKNLSIEEIQ